MSFGGVTADLDRSETQLGTQVLQNRNAILSHLKKGLLMFSAAFSCLELWSGLAWEHSEIIQLLYVLGQRKIFFWGQF